MQKCEVIFARALSPDAIGYRIFSIGMDVIVHFTCRDMNRVGMESRALQLAMIGMKNILALTGDFSGKGFGGQGAPVFDLDSVNLQIMLKLIGKRIKAAGDPDGFFTGCAVSPFKQPDGFYAFRETPPEPATSPVFGLRPQPLPVVDRVLCPLMQHSHNLFFNFESPLSPMYRRVCQSLDSSIAGRLFLHLAEHPIKRMLLGCQQCGDCAIQHAGFLCPESGCPKHTRNSACGGSRHGMCEVNTDRRCVWFRAHNRLAAKGKIKEMCDGCVPPRMWELNNTSSWLNITCGGTTRATAVRLRDSAGRRPVGYCRRKAG